MNRAEKAKLLLAGFPDITPEIMQQIHENADHYMLFLAKRAKCTACNREFNGEDIASMQLRHGQRVVCPNCGKTVKAMKNHMNYSDNVSRGERNMAIFQAKDNVAYVHCIKVSSRLYHADNETGEWLDIIENQRYAFADGQAYRFGRDYGWIRVDGHYKRTYTSDWLLRTKFTEPIFDPADMGRSGYYADKSYMVIDMACLQGTCLRYAMAEQFDGRFLFQYLQFYLRHPNAEYLIKLGFGYLINKKFEYTYSITPGWIDWKQNDVRKMLGVNSRELHLLQETKTDIERYRIMREEIPGLQPEEIVRYLPLVGSQYGKLDAVCKATEQSRKRMLKYLWKQAQKCSDKQTDVSDMYEYLRQCKELHYDMQSKMVLMPRCLMEAHERTTNILEELAKERRAKENMKERKRRKQKLTADEAKLEERKAFRDTLYFAQAGVFVRAPESLAEIVDEGAIMNHCVGGYAERHANGVLHILFLRREEKPDIPFYTMEVSTKGEIVQVRGPHNGPMTPQVEQFVENYKQHLAMAFAKADKERVRVSA